MSRDNPHARDVMLARIRRALGVAGDDVARRVAVQRRLSAPRANTVPARASGSRTELVAAFRARLEQQSATFATAAAIGEVPALVAAYLREHNLPARIRMGSDPAIAALPWSEAPAVQIEHGAAAGSDEVGFSRAIGAAAETGTLVLTSGPDNPTTINFLPETHVVLLAAADVAGSYEEIWRRLRTLHGDRTLPRTVNYISGPSRTADIEGMLVMGAHGPRRLHVILVGEA